LTREQMADAVVASNRAKRDANKDPGLMLEIENAIGMTTGADASHSHTHDFTDVRGVETGGHTHNTFISGNPLYAYIDPAQKGADMTVQASATSSTSPLVDTCSRAIKTLPTDARGRLAAAIDAALDNKVFDLNPGEPLVLVPQSALSRCFVGGSGDDQPGQGGPVPPQVPGGGSGGAPADPKSGARRDAEEGVKRAVNAIGKLRRTGGGDPTAEGFFI
jgi:hypothetical protein